jgi:6-phosphogluconolactonase
LTGGGTGISLLKHVGAHDEAIDWSKVHIFWGDDRFVPADDPAPAFDVHLLGMGGEGHINSLFPHTPAVAETSRMVVGVEDSPKPPPRRITLTLPAVTRSREVWLVVSGDAKADAVAAAIGGASPDEVPAAGAVGREATVWLLDTGAASKL